MGNPIVRDEVYRIGYEAIRNGVGIDSDILHRCKPGHFGLQNMRERAARIMGKFSVESSAGSGTVIGLTVPGGIIYRTVNT